jgi:hypothetical protein
MRSGPDESRTPGPHSLVGLGTAAVAFYRISGCRSDRYVISFAVQVVFC